MTQEQFPITHVVLDTVDKCEHGAKPSECLDCHYAPYRDWGDENQWGMFS